jgi:LmbE family N-acetylglucosaminyl deacetylase
LQSDACFLAGLSKIETTLNGVSQESFRPNFVYHYIQDRLLKPDFVVDITPYFEKKMAAIKAFKSQFYDKNSQEPATYISNPNYFDYIEARMLEYGHAIGVRYGEGFIKQRQLGIANLFNLV